jgi:hypothetical protein
MPDLYNEIGQNARKVTPSTQFGTRQIVSWSIYTNADIETDWELPNSLYSQLVRALQQNVELYAVHMPGQAFFTSNNEYAFRIEAAWDTGVSLWAAQNAFVPDDVDPSVLQWGNDDFQQNSDILIDVVYNVLNNAGVDTSCWVYLNYVNGDMTWQVSAPFPGMVEGQRTARPPKSGRQLENNVDLLPLPGDSLEVRKQKKLQFLARMRA